MHLDELQCTSISCCLGKTTLCLLKRGLMDRPEQNTILIEGVKVLASVKVALAVSFIRLICGYFCFIRYQSSHNFPSWSNP